MRAVQVHGAAGRDGGVRAARRAQPRRRRARRDRARTGRLRSRARPRHRSLRRLGRAAAGGAARRCPATPRCASTSAPPRPSASIVWLDGRAALAPQGVGVRAARVARADRGVRRRSLHPARAEAPRHHRRRRRARSVRAATAAPRSTRACRTSRRCATAATPLERLRRAAGARQPPSPSRPKRSRPPPTCAPTRCAPCSAGEADAASAARCRARRGVHDGASAGSALRTAIADALAAYHRAQPRQPRHGDGVAALAARAPISHQGVPRRHRTSSAREQILVREESLLRLPAHSGGLSTAARRALAEALVARLADAVA